MRREALEMALYTFKYVPAVNAVIAYLPPPQGQPPSKLLYLERSNLADELHAPLAKTLPVDPPPLPSAARCEGVELDRQADGAGRVPVPGRGAAGRHRRDRARAQLRLETRQPGARKQHQ